MALPNDTKGNQSHWKLKDKSHEGKDGSEGRDGREGIVGILGDGKLLNTFVKDFISIWENLARLKCLNVSESSDKSQAKSNEKELIFMAR